MKTAASLLALSLIAVVPAQAQLFRPETVTGAVIGGAVGAVIGHNDDRHGWEGAAYGAAAGALIGSLAGHANDRAQYRATQVPVPAYGGYSGYHGPRYPGRVVVGRPAYHYPHYVYRAPAVVYAPRAVPTYVYPARRPNYVRTGVLLGGIAGAIIGHNDGRHGWEGAAYGVGAGLILGSIAERNAARAEAEARAYEEDRAARAATAATPTAAPQQVTINNYYYGNTAASPMSSANGLFGR